jgi:preprotein translocase subunit YajC
MRMTVALLQQSAPTPGAQGALFQLIPFVAIFAIFYFLLIAPMRKRQKKTREMLSQLKKGDQVVTTGGIFGRIAAIDEKNQTLVLSISDQVKIKVTRGAIAGLAGDETATGSISNP